jgi:hypothetical protein
MAARFGDNDATQAPSEISGQDKKGDLKTRNALSAYCAALHE